MSLSTPAKAAAVAERATQPQSYTDSEVRSAAALLGTPAFAPGRVSFSATVSSESTVGDTTATACAVGDLRRTALQELYATPLCGRFGQLSVGARPPRPSLPGARFGYHDAGHPIGARPDLPHVSSERFRA